MTLDEQALIDQPLERLAHGDARQIEALRQLALAGDDRAGGNDALLDGAAQRILQAFVERGRTVDLKPTLALQVIDELLAWWDDCARRQVPAVLFCYALGKAQRILAELALRTERTVHLHGAMLRLVENYREAGVAMVPTEPVNESAKGRDFAGELILAPPSAAGSPWMKRFAKASTGFASGWMQIRGNRRRRGYDRGFVVSDHADWPGLLRSVEDSQASRIYVTHGDGEALIRHLRELGHDAQSLRLLRTVDDESGG